MGEATLAKRIGQSTAEAKHLLDLHRKTYARFWRWSDRVRDNALLKGKLRTAFGWQLHVGKRSNVRSLCNFPMQANGAEMLRIASILMVQNGISLCAPVHDAVLIEAPLDRLEHDLAQAQNLMSEASRLVLGGFQLNSDAKIIRHPDRFEDERGIDMWQRTIALLVKQHLAQASPSALSSIPMPASIPLQEDAYDNAA